MDVRFDVDLKLDGLRALPGAVKRHTRAAGRRAGLRFAQAAAAAAPKRTGYMASQITYELVDDGAGFLLRVFGRAPYTPFQERRRHFLDAAFDGGREQAERDVQDQVDRAVEETNR
jgi:hypothetical protein